MNTTSRENGIWKLSGASPWPFRGRGRPRSESHPRSALTPVMHLKHGTLFAVRSFREHMPIGHKAYAEWSPSRIINWANKAGPCCGEVCKKIMEQREHPELGYRSCLGVINLGKKYSSQRLENACRRALEIGGISYQSIKSILSNDLPVRRT